MSVVNDPTLQAALAEVEAELAEMAKAEKALALKKAREESKGGSGSPAASASPEGSAGGDAGGPPSAEGSEGGEAPPAGPPSAGAPGQDPSASAAAPGAPGQDPSAGAGAMPTLEQIVAEYSKLPPEELKLYYLAIKTALAQVAGAGMGAGPSAGAPGAAPMGAGPSAGGMPPPSAPPAGDPSAGAGAPPPMAPMGKSESDKKMEALLKKFEASLAESQKDVATLSKALELVVGQPQRKGVTGIEYVRRAAPIEEPEAPAITDPSKLTKSEMNSKLSSMVRSGKLKKSDLENVSKFCEGGQKQIDLVQHLFVPAAK